MTKKNSNKSANIDRQLKPGPLAVIRDEDGVGLVSTLQHCQKIGFPNILVFGREDPSVEGVVFVEVSATSETSELLNRYMDGLAGRWIFLGHNSEYLYFPFCEGRSVWDAAQFIEEERRDSVFCTTVDLYPSSIDRHHPALSMDDAYFDADGYFSRDRYDGPDVLERQVDVFGGLKWRYAEHIEWTRQRIDRIAFFRANTGLRLDEFGLFNQPEMNTITCPWHHNMTFCVASYRVAKSLINNPGSTYEIESFMWDRSEKFQKTSQQLMKLGLMEPGQWF